MLTEPNFGWVSLSRVTDVTGLEYSMGSTFDAMSPIYKFGSNFCSNTVETDELYVPKPVCEKGAWYLDSGATHHVCKGATNLND